MPHNGQVSFDNVTRGACARAHHSRIAPHQGVEKAGFPDVRRAGEGDTIPGANLFTPPVVSGVIERRAEASVEKTPAPFRRSLRPPSPAVMQGLEALRVGLRLDKVGDTFGFDEVESPVVEGAAGELSRLGRPHVLRDQSPAHRLDDGRSAMQV